MGADVLAQSLTPACNWQKIRSDVQSIQSIQSIAYDGRNCESGIDMGQKKIRKSVLKTEEGSQNVIDVKK